MKDKLKGSICLVLATVIWGSAFIAQSVGMDLIGPFTFQSIRCILAVVFLVCVTFVVEARHVPLHETICRWKNTQLWKAGIICGIALFFAASLQQVGLVYTDAGKAGFITAMYIVLVPILGLFIKKKPNFNAVISVIIAVAGLYLLSCMESSGINIGDMLILGCAFGFAVQILFVDHFAGELDGLRLNCVQALVVAILSIPCMLISEKVDLQNIAACWLPLAFAGILSMGVAYTLQIVGQKDLEPTTASLIMSLESVFAALGGWLVLKEVMTGWELTGCAMVFCAVIISQLPRKHK